MSVMPSKSQGTSSVSLAMIYPKSVSIQCVTTLTECLGSTKGAKGDRVVSPYVGICLPTERLQCQTAVEGEQGGIDVPLPSAVLDRDAPHRGFARGIFAESHRSFGIQVECREKEELCEGCVMEGRRRRERNKM